MHAVSSLLQRVCSDIESTISFLRRDKGAKSVATVGFCFGGKFSMLSGAQGMGSVQGAVVVHGSRLEAQDGERLRCPCLMLNAEDDVEKSPEVYAALQEALQDAPPGGFHTLKGTTHGFALRGDPADPAVVQAQQEVKEKTLAFLREVLGGE